MSVDGERLCEACRRPLEPGRPRNAVYHRGGICKQRAWRRRQAGLPPDATLNRRRGRLRIGQPTKAERIAAFKLELEQTLGRMIPPEISLRALEYRLNKWRAGQETERAAREE